MGPQLYRCGNLGEIHHRRRVPRDASMGPQLYRCGNCHAPRWPSTWRIKLQWGRNFIVAETWCVPCTDIGILLLQWGRNFIVAETRRGPAAPAGHKMASMGPQLYRCGNVPKHCLLYSLQTASMGPQLYRCGNPYIGSAGCRPSTSFNGAATLSLRKCCDCVVVLEPHSRFNGAATLSLRKCRLQIQQSSARLHASMGPQLYRCGNWHARIL